MFLLVTRPPIGKTKTMTDKIDKDKLHDPKGKMH